MAEHKDLGNAGADIYEIIFGVKELKDVHKNLFDIIFPFMQKSEGKRLLVLGPGPQGSPYFKRPEEFTDIFKGKPHKVVFLEYNIGNIADCFLSYHNLGILRSLKPRIVLSSQESFLRFRANEALMNTLLLYERDTAVVRETIEKQELSDRLTFVEHNLRDKIPDLGQFDAVDSTFTLHHVSNYQPIIQNRFDEIHSILREGGLFHKGTGLCDMTYSEKKIIRIGNEISKILSRKITTIDKRDPNRAYTLSFDDGKFKTIREGDFGDEASIVTDENAYIHVPTMLAAYYPEYERCTRVASEDHFVTPLIDPRLHEDTVGLVLPVQKFYMGTHLKIANMPGELARKAARKDREEWDNAAKGLVEYYLPESGWMKLLSKFGRVDVRRSDDCNFANFAAYK